MCSQTRFTDERTNLGTEERNSGLTTEAEQQDDTPGTSPQSVAAMTGTNLEADIANAAAVVNGPVGCKITNNQDTEQPLRQNIKELDKTLEQHCREAFANVEDTCNIRGQMEGLKEVGSHRAELSRLEGEVLPQLMAQRDEVKYQLQKHSNNTKEKVDGIPALPEKLKNLSEKLEQHDNDVSSVREEVSKLSRVNQTLHDEIREMKTHQSQLEKQLKDRLRIIKEEMEWMTTDLQREVETKWKLLGKLPRILEAVLEELDQEPKAAEILERYIEQTCNQCTKDDQVNATGGGKLTHSTRDAPPRGEELLESGHNIRLPSGTGCHQTLNDIDKLRMIQEEFNKMTAYLQKYVETNLKVPPGKLLTILEAVLRYPEQERKVRQEGKYTLKRAGKWLVNSIFGKS